MSKLTDKLKDWNVGGISVLAIYESAHELGVLDSLELTPEQHMHGLALIMAVFLIVRGLYERKSDAG